MSTDETTDDETPIDADGPSGVDEETDVRERLEEEADRAVGQFDEGIVDLLSWLLDTETRARIYVHLRQQPNSTSDEIAEGTGLYPSTVRKALAELHDEGRVSRRKRENEGAGNNPYEYSALAPSEFVSEMATDVQRQLNTVFNMDQILGTGDEVDDEPVTITVTEERDENRRENGTSVDVDDGASDDASDDHDASTNAGEDANDTPSEP